MSTILGNTLCESLLAAADRHGADWCLRVVRSDGSFQDMDRLRFLDMALRAAAWMRSVGVAPGDRVILCLENSTAWGAAYFSVLLAGGVAVPVDIASVPSDASYYLEKTRARLVLSSRRDLFTGDLPAGCLLAHTLDAALAHAPLPREAVHPAAPDDPAVLIFTSGTTGRPKAVQLTHANLLANVDSVARCGLLLPGDNLLAVLPLHHAYPCMVNLLVPLLLGARTTFVETLKPEAILGALKTAGVSILVLTPQYVGVFYRRILKRFEDLPLGVGKLVAAALRATANMRPDLLGVLRRAVRKGVGPDFRFFVTGGAKCDPEVIAGMEALGIGVLEGYGLSETAPLVSINRPDTGRPGSVGQALPGVEVRIDRTDAEGFGEILIRGANVMPGYFEDPDASAKALQDGWFHTGDQGRMDPDGSIFVRGRERDIIVLQSGKKFPAEEIENHYRQAPSVGEICVLPGPDGSLRAVITPDQEFFRTTDSTDLRQNIRWDLEVLSRELPPYKRVGNFVVISAELPKTRLGKVKRHLVEKMLIEGQDGVSSEGAPWPELGQAGEAALAAIREAAGLGADAGVAPTSHLELDLGLDSLKRLELLTLLEDALRRPVEEERFQRLATAAEVVGLARELALESGRDSAVDNGDGPGSPDVRSAGVNSGLHGDLPSGLAHRVRLDFGTPDRLATSAVGGLLDAAIRLGFGLTVRGAQNIPEGAAIICCNHASFLDGFVVLSATPRRQRMRLYFLGLARFFDAPLVGRLAARFRLIAVDAGRISETMRLSSYVLRHGKLLCVFPEGARTVTGTLQQFRKGPVTLSMELGVPVVPAAVTGTFEAWPVGGKLRRHKLAVTFGAPMMPGTPEEVRDAVKALLGEGER